MKKLRILFMALAAIAVAAPAFAQVQNNSERPGSVLVFHKFLTGTVAPNTPRTSFEISVTCPAGPTGCADTDVVRIKGLWVCEGLQEPQFKRICQATDFTLRTTVKGTIWFNPENASGEFSPATTSGSNFAPFVGRPNCPRGYLIVWVIDASGRPISYNGLIGNGLIRFGANDVSAYNALPIQSPAAQGTVLAGANDLLNFNGIMYARITGNIYGTVRYERRGNVTQGAVQTDLTLLTLDVRANRPNFVTFAPLFFYNEHEQPISTFVEFICWTERRLTDIDRNLTTRFGGMGAEKGLVETSATATQQDTESFPPAEPFNATLVGIIETREYIGGGATAVLDRSYAYSLFNDGVGVSTAFCHNSGTLCPVP